MFTVALASGTHIFGVAASQLRDWRPAECENYRCRGPRPAHGRSVRRKEIQKPGCPFKLDLAGRRGVTLSCQMPGAAMETLALLAHPPSSWSWGPQLRDKAWSRCSLSGGGRGFLDRFTAGTFGTSHKGYSQTT
jgi:hypothetical protein